MNGSVGMRFHNGEAVEVLSSTNVNLIIGNLGSEEKTNVKLVDNTG
jgi:hypothetical protein